MERSDVKRGIADGVPIVLGYVPLGFAYGVLARGSGLNVAETVAMSVLVYAGSAQFVAVGLLGAGASLGLIVVTTFLINLRHLLMSTSLVPHLRGIRRPVLALLGFQITDESFLVASARYAQEQGTGWYQFGLNMTAHAGWISGSFLGALGGSMFGVVENWGLEFALPAMFIALLAVQLKRRAQWIVAGASAIISVGLAVALPSMWNTVAATVTAAAVGVLIDDES